MHVTVLGSGTLLPNDKRRSPAHLVETENANVLLDCGSGTLHGFDRHRVPWRTLTHVVISHYHTDHIGDLAPLLFALRHGVRPPREQPLFLLGPQGLGALLESLRAAFGEYVLRPGFPLEVVELGGGGRWEDPLGRLVLGAHETLHTDASLAYRVERSGDAVGYTGDTGLSDALGDFFRGVPLLIAECSVEDPPSLDAHPRGSAQDHESDRSEVPSAPERSADGGGGARPLASAGGGRDTAPAPHLSPRTLAALAGRAKPELLVVTHLYPPLRPHRIPALLRAAGYAGRVVVARDGTRVEVREGRAVEEA